MSKLTHEATSESNSKPFPDLHQSREQPLTKVVWTCIPESTPSSHSGSQELVGTLFIEPRGRPISTPQFLLKYAEVCRGDKTPNTCVCVCVCVKGGEATC